MKSTIIMLSFLGTIIITWMMLGLAAYLLTDIPTYKQCMTSNGVLMLMLLFGWIPSIVVSIDMEEKIKYF